MLGLIQKDLLMVRGNLKTILIIFVVYALMAMNGNGDFSFIPAFISVMIMISTFSYDEYNKSDAYIATLPEGRAMAVKAKYAATLLIAVLSVLITFVVSCLIGGIQKQLDMEYILSTTLGCVSGVLLVQAVLYPIIYKFGVEKGRIGMFVLVFGIVGIGSLFLKSGLSISIPAEVGQFFEQFWMVVIPLILLFVLWISYRVSKRFYVQKEF